ncbi:MAG: inositol monophosphatase [Clostridia bacterium]|nr:inositol monophosphatase [Clostridia bacterium]
MDIDRAKVSRKGNNSNYVTSADINVQNYLSEKFLELMPESSILGEEDEKDDIKDGYIWIIDPIDGTSNFIRNVGFSAISVALFYNDVPLVGVIYNPTRDEMFHAEKGKGAYLNAERIHVSDRDYQHSHLCSAMSLYAKEYAKPCFNIIERIYMEADDLRRMGTAALELAYIAAGRFELYFEMRVFPWDVAAGLLLIKEAGGFIECLYYDDMPKNRPFPVYAANSRKSLERIKKIICEEIPEIPY